MTMGFATRLDQVSGAEVPETEIVVTQAMREAGHHAIAAIISNYAFWPSTAPDDVFIAMERARRAEKTTIPLPLKGET